MCDIKLELSKYFFQLNLKNYLLLLAKACVKHFHISSSDFIFFTYLAMITSL